MRTKIMMALSVGVLAVLNYGIYENEQIKEHGEQNPIRFWCVGRNSRARIWLCCTLPAP